MKLSVGFLLLASVTTAYYLRAEIGCMDNSYHLQKSNDPKTYHYVQCNCPCKQYKQLLYKGSRCTKCQHAHDPQLAQLVRNEYNATALNTNDSLARLRWFRPGAKKFVSTSCPRVRVNK